MKLITITGGKASGKDTLIDALTEHFSKKLPGKVSRSIFSHTRKPRKGDKPGENIDLISEQEFEKRFQTGEISFTDISSKGRVGYKAQEIFKNEIVFCNISRNFITSLKSIVKDRGGEVFSIYLDVSLPVRRLRLGRREGGFTPDYIEAQLESDPGIEQDKRSYNKYDFILENKEGQFEKTLELAISKIQEFIYGQTKT